MDRFAPNCEMLESRENPSSMSVPQSLLAAAAADSADLTGPLGGNLQISVDIVGNKISESVVWTGPNGRTASEIGSFVYNPFSGNISGTVTYVGINGGSLTGMMTGTLSGNTLNETTIFAGQNGDITQHGVYVGGQNSLQSNSSVTGPQGQTVSKTALWNYDSANGTLSGSGTLTGPNGKSIDWTRVFHVGS